MPPVLSTLITVCGFVISGMLAHFIAENRGRPLREPWLVTGGAMLAAVVCMFIVPNLLFVFAMLPVPPASMFLFRRIRGPEDPLTCPCPHCQEEFVVDARYGGQPVRCPSCKQLFLGPKVIS